MSPGASGMTVGTDTHFLFYVLAKGTWGTVRKQSTGFNETHLLFLSRLHHCLSTQNISEDLGK